MSNLYTLKVVAEVSSVRAASENWQDCLQFPERYEDIKFVVQDHCAEANFVLDFPPFNGLEYQPPGAKYPLQIKTLKWVDGCFVVDHPGNGRLAEYKISTLFPRRVPLSVDDLLKAIKYNLEKYSKENVIKSIEQPGFEWTWRSEPERLVVFRQERPLVPEKKKRWLFF